MTPPPPSLFANSFSRWFFLVLIVLVLYLSYQIISPFLLPIFLSMTLVVVGGPMYQGLLRLVRGRRYLASALTCLVLMGMILLPFFLLGGVLTAQALELYTSVSHQLSQGDLPKMFNFHLGDLDPLFERLREAVGVSRADIYRELGELVRRVSNLVYVQFTEILAGVTNFLIGFALVMFITFYLLMDGEELAKRLMSLSPLPGDTNQQIRAEMLSTLKATLRATVMLALINGGICGVGFGLFGVPKAVFWGVTMVMASVVPLIGTGLIWVPTVIYLLVQSQTGAAIGVGVWCLVVGLVCDNILRPRFLGGATNIHPLATFFSVLGGLGFFGLTGLILGPMVLAILLSLLGIYEKHFLSPAPLCMALETSHDGDSGPGPP
ncbi:MAG: AI-2E family transporter [Deltaproteobacteria bacterium]|nr:AI-2E family transporter [Deltaproteobacteria bacterium]